jgi:DNA repair exonuclease SbcCD nuclease subunit
MYDNSYSSRVKIIHTGDLHIDSPLHGLEHYEGAPVAEMVGATRAAFVNLVEYAVGNEVSLILIAGDVYDSDWRDYNTGLFFQRQLVRLQEAGVRVVMVHGNHDAVSTISRTLPLPENTKVLSHKRPETAIFGDIGVAVTGQSFATAAVTDNLTQGFPDLIPDLLNVALLHTSADGRPGHERYAPCKPSELALRGYDYSALGHVHAREILSRTPWITFCGNLQGRHARETGAKGFFVIEVEDGAVDAVTPVDVDVVRWQAVTIDVADATTLDEVADRFGEAAAAAVAEAEDRLVAARVTLGGESPAHPDLIRDPDRLRAHLCAAAAEACGEGLWLEKVIVRTSTPRRVVSIATRDEPLLELFASLDDADSDEEAAALAAELAPLRQKLPAELRRTDDDVEIGSPEHIASLMPDIEAFLREELIRPEAAR